MRERSLSPRHERIARLVVEGRTNREIAAEVGMRRDSIVRLKQTPAIQDAIEATRAKTVAAHQDEVERLFQKSVALMEMSLDVAAERIKANAENAPGLQVVMSAFRELATMRASSRGQPSVLTERRIVLSAEATPRSADQLRAQLRMLDALEAIDVTPTLPARAKETDDE